MLVIPVITYSNVQTGCSLEKSQSKRSGWNFLLLSLSVFLYPLLCSMFSVPFRSDQPSFKIKKFFPPAYVFLFFSTPLCLAWSFALDSPFRGNKYFCQSLSFKSVLNVFKIPFHKCPLLFWASLSVSLSLCLFYSRFDLFRSGLKNLPRR